MTAKLAIPPSGGSPRDVALTINYLLERVAALEQTVQELQARAESEDET